MITWSEYNRRVAERVSSMPDQSAGRAYAEVLRDTRPDLSGVVRDTADDPFYSDHRIPRFLVRLRKLWHDPVASDNLT